jgi:hypothetical protein
MIKQLEPQIGVRIRKTIIGYGLRSGDRPAKKFTRARLWRVKWFAVFSQE